MSPSLKERAISVTLLGRIVSPRWSRTALKPKKVPQLINWIRFRIGKLFFPVMEPVYHWIENRDPEVKKHFDQAVSCLEAKKTAIALLNLNMVLSLKPNHFLAHVQRGRIYIRENRFRLASEDFLEANKINSYRFMYHNLYQEYFQSVNREMGDLGESISYNFNQVVDVLRQAQESGNQEQEKEEQIEWFDSLSPVGPEFDGEEEVPTEEPGLNDSEREKFEELGPITLQEIEDTDWDRLIKELST